MRTMTTVVSARLRRRSPPRLSLCLNVFPDEAGMGQVPASAANAASERTRPGCDHAVKTDAATTEPTPGSSHSSGAVSSTAASSALRLSTSSPLRATMRLANRIAPAEGAGNGFLDTRPPPSDDLDLTAGQRFTG